MSDSKETNELDSYGVWVKTPPKTVDSSDTTFNNDAFDLNTDLPDFSELDVIDEPGDFADPAGTENAVSEEEISLDEFIEGGIFETGPDEDKIREKEAEKMSASAQTAEPEAQTGTTAVEDPSDDFSVTADPVDEISEPDFDSPESGSLSEDDIFNVDLSFDGSETPQAAADFSETSGFMADAPAADSPAGTEDVDLSEFGLDDLDFEGGESSAEQTEDVSDGSGGMETVDLSEFGFDDSDEPENRQDFSETAGQETADEAELKNEAEQEGAEEFSLEQEVPLEEEPVALEEEVTPVEEPASDSSDDDFDLDSILDNITDENGNTVTLDETSSPDTEDTEESSPVEEAVFAEEPETFADQEPLSEATGEEEAVADNPVAITNAEIEALSMTTSEPAFEEAEVPAVETVEAAEEAFEEPVIETPAEDALEPAVEEEFKQEAPEPVFSAENAENAENAEETEEPEIPDTFDEEAASFLEADDEKVAEIADSITAPILEESEPEEQKPSAQMTALFSQIVTELSSLKNEISSLKNEFETLKNTGAGQPEKLNFEEAPASENEGFFSDSNEDDTIALSKDEMDNILNTADIAQADETENQEPENVSAENLFGSTEEAVDFSEEDVVSDDDFSMEFESAGEEPALEEVDYTAVTSEDELPEEISVPKTEDILVESSPTDLLDTSENAETEPVLDEPEFSAETELAAEPDELLEEDPFGLSTEDSSITDTFIEEKMDYLSSSPVEEEVLPETAEEPVSEDGANALSDDAPAAVETESEEKSGDSLSDDLKSEIKSVLSYMDQLLENLPENKIAEFAQSEQFDTYKKLFKELGLA